MHAAYIPKTRSTTKGKILLHRGNTQIRLTTEQAHCLIKELQHAIAHCNIGTNSNRSLGLRPGLPTHTIIEYWDCYTKHEKNNERFLEGVSHE